MAVVFSFRGQSLATQRHVPLCWTPLSQKTTVRIPELLEVVLPMGRTNTPYPPPRYQRTLPGVGVGGRRSFVDQPQGQLTGGHNSKNHPGERPSSGPLPPV